MYNGLSSEKKWKNAPFGGFLTKKNGAWLIFFKLKINMLQGASNFFKKKFTIVLVNNNS